MHICVGTRFAVKCLAVLCVLLSVLGHSAAQSDLSQSDLSQSNLSSLLEVHLVVGSALNNEEFTRLRILEDLTSDVTMAEISTDSMEAGMLALVLNGNATYFENASTAVIELEDVITIHTIEDSDDIWDKVKTLLDQGQDDTDDSAVVGGNRAFLYSITEQRASLDPTQALLNLCPFATETPPLNVPMSSNMLRRDMQDRQPQAPPGSVETVTEVCADSICPPTSTYDVVKNIIGDSAYASDLAVAYATVIRDTYELNGRFRRAFWSNPCA
eukprot:3836335-Rhodomonas_salina.1